MKIRKIILVLMLLTVISSLFGSGFGESITNQLKDYGIPKPLIVILISMLPIVELRGAIPVAIGLLDMHWFEAALYAILGNMLPIPFVLLFMGWFTEQLNKWEPTKKFLNWLFARTRKKSEVIQKYEEIGLTLFIAIPLPVTGAWTGSLAAYIFGLKFWKSMACALGGVLIASVVVTIMTLGIGALL